MKKCYCPYCGQNCYTVGQLNMHIARKRTYACQGRCADDHVGIRRYQHSGGEVEIIIDNSNTFMSLDNCNWTERDLDELDAKFDALSEYLGVEFVFEKISDGSKLGNKVRIYARRKAGIDDNLTS